MANPLFNTLGGRQAPAANDGGFGAMMTQFAKFRQTFQGDARAEVQRLLNSGQMSQDEYNRLSAMANQIVPMLK